MKELRVALLGGTATKSGWRNKPYCVYDFATAVEKAGCRGHGIFRLKQHQESSTQSNIPYS